MARAIGVQFAVGASLSQTVASAFGTVGSRIRTLRSDLRGLQSASRAAEALSRTRGQMLSANAAHQAAPTEATAAALERTRRAYRASAAAARTYGLSVRDIEREQARLREGLARTEAALGRQRQLQANQDKRKELQGQIMGTVASVATVAVPITLAINFESDFADVKKVADFASAEQEKKVEKYIFDSARRSGINASGMAKIAASAAESGVVNNAQGDLDEEKLKQFLSDASEMSVAYGISAEEAGKRLSDLQHRMGLTAIQTRTMGDAMNYIASKTSATAAATLNVTARMAGMKNLAGISEKTMVGLAAAFVANSENQETAGTALKSFLATLSQGEGMTKQQKEVFKRMGIHSVKSLAEGLKKGGPEAEKTILTVLSAIKKMPEAEQAGIAKEIFGLESLASIAPLVNDPKQLIKFLDLAHSTNAAGSQLKEFITRSDTTQGALDRLKTSAGILGITIGKVMLPPIRAVANYGANLLVPLTVLVEEFPQVTQAIMFTAAGLVVFKVASLAGMYAATMLSDAWILVSAAANKLRWSNLASTAALVQHRVAMVATATATRIAAAGQWLLNAAMTANPIGLVVAGVAALGAGFIYLYNKSEAFRNIVTSGMSAVATVFRTAAAIIITPYLAAWEGIKAVWGTVSPWFGQMWANVSGWASTAWTSTTGYASAAWSEITATWGNVSNYFSENFGAVAALCSSVWNGVGSTIGAVWDGVRTKAMELFDWLESKFAWIGTVSSTMSTAWSKAKSLVGLEKESTGKTQVPTVKAQPARTAVVTDAPTAAATPTASSAPGAAASKPAMPQEQAATRAASGPAPRSASQAGQASPTPQTAPSVSVTQNFTLNGVTDKIFADRVVASANARQSEFEKLFKDIMGDAMRLSYEH